MKIKTTLKKLNQRGFSHHLIMPAVVLIAVTAVGVKVLTQSHAASDYSFTYGVNQMSGGTLVNKAGGTSYRNVVYKKGATAQEVMNNQYVFSPITIEQLNASEYVCVHFLGGKGFVDVGLVVDKDDKHFAGHWNQNHVWHEGGSSGYACIDVVDALYKGNMDPRTPFMITAGIAPAIDDAQNTNLSLQIDSIYGKKTGTDYTFIRRVDQMNGGKLNGSVRTLDEVLYPGSYGQNVSTWISTAEAIRTKYVCVHFVQAKGQIDFSVDSVGLSLRTVNTPNGYWCQQGKPGVNAAAVNVGLHNKQSAISVDTFYGKP